MNDNLKSMYDDFFGANSKLIVDERKSKDDEFKIDIDELLLDSESKDLLKKIIQYSKDYNESKVSNYITFNILLMCENKETVDKVVKILKGISSYIKNTSVSNFSLFNLNDSSNISDLYKNGIVIINDLNAFSMKENNTKTLFLHNLKSNLNGKSITLLVDSFDNVNNFLYNDSHLKENFFMFELKEINPGVQDVYNEVLSKVEVDDQKKVELLDYISATYDKRSNDYVSYRNKLINHIAFNNSIPTISKTKSNEEIFKELNELVGLKDVKQTLNDLVNLISLKDKTKDSLTIKDINLHMVFLGNPGTGKTTVARLLSGILYNLGYIKEDKLIEVSSKDLVAEYVGQTAPKTNAVLDKAKGGILFIDEAYALASDNNSYNDEAIATLIKGMEDYRDNLVVIFAGYTKEMNAFLNSNSGIVSRIGYTLNFKDYTVDELIEIFKGMISKAGFNITDGAIEKAKAIINDNIMTKNFGNARFVRNMYEKTIVKHATNTKDKKKKDILTTITEDDVNVENLLS